MKTFRKRINQTIGVSLTNAIIGDVSNIKVSSHRQNGIQGLYKSSTKIEKVYGYLYSDVWFTEAMKEKELTK